MFRNHFLSTVLIFGCTFCFAQEKMEFDFKNIRIFMKEADHSDAEKTINHYTNALKREDLRPVEKFFAHTEIAQTAMNERNFATAIRNATAAISIASEYEDQLSGLIRTFYIQNLRHLYECEEWKKMLGQAGDPIKEYNNMLLVFERHKDWKRKHPAEYLAILVGLVGASESGEDKELCMDRIIEEVPSAQTTPFWIWRRYEFDITKDWEASSARIRTLMDRYDEYPYKILLYDLLARGHKRRGEIEEAIACYEAGIKHIQKPFNQLSESERKHFVDGQTTKDQIFTMKNQCASLYIELGKWDEARKILDDIITNAEEGTNLDWTKSLLSFIDNNPPGTKYQRGRRGRRATRTQ